MTGSDRASAKSTAAPASIYWPGQQQRSCTSGAWAGRARLDSRAESWPSARRPAPEPPIHALRGGFDADHLVSAIMKLSSVGPQATACLQLRVPYGWQSFTDPALFADLRTLHRVLREIYDAVADACLTGTIGKWRRPTLNASQADNVRLPLSSASRAALAHYLTALKPGLLADTGFYADPRNRHRTTHVYPLADLAYSMCFSEHHSQLFAHVRLNVFSDLGGAGVSVINGTVVKVRKGVGTYDEEELGARAAFQRGFLTALRRHPDLGATALYPLLVST
jgi:hypothetical protein